MIDNKSTVVWTLVHDCKMGISHCQQVRIRLQIQYSTCIEHEMSIKSAHHMLVQDKIVLTFNKKDWMLVEC